MEAIVKRFDELTTEELFSIYKLRVEVFVVEQMCVYQEVDDDDRDAYHIWLSDGDSIAAYMRVLPCSGEDGARFGRVIAKKRRCGLGSRVISEGVRIAKDVIGADKVYVHAQTYARDFYEKNGFSQVSDEFDEDGIPHIKMMMNL